MTDDLVKRLRKATEKSTTKVNRSYLVVEAANRIEELEALVDRLIVTGRDLCCHVPSADLVTGVSDETKDVLKEIIWKEGKDDQ